MSWDLQTRYDNSALAIIIGSDVLDESGTAVALVSIEPFMNLLA